MANIFTTHLVFENNIDFSKNEQSKFTKELKEKFDIEIYHLDVSERDIVIHTKGIKLVTKHIKGLVDKLKEKGTTVKIYMNNDVSDYYRAFKL